jgi:hypothetical protein
MDNSLWKRLRKTVTSLHCSLAYLVSYFSVASTNSFLGSQCYKTMLVNDRLGWLGYIEWASEDTAGLLTRLIAEMCDLNCHVSPLRLFLEQVEENASILLKINLRVRSKPLLIFVSSITFLRSLQHPFCHQLQVIVKRGAKEIERGRERK